MAGTTQCFNVTVLPDDLVEGVEDFFLNVVAASALVTVDSATNQATVNILDDDSRSHSSGTQFLVLMAVFIAGAIFELDMSSYSATEDQGSQTVLAVLQSGDLAVNVVVTLQTVTNPQATATGKTYQ